MALASETPRTSQLTGNPSLMEYYRVLQQHYEKTLQQHGANAKGMDWPNAADLDRRFQVLTSIIPPPEQRKTAVSLLDLGCGVGLLTDFLENNKLNENLAYFGSDISEKMIEAAKSGKPQYQFEVRDVLVTPYADNQFDYTVMNGVLTEKQGMTQEQMVGFAQRIIQSAFKASSKGIAFNVMSSHVDWKRDDLFHWELDNAVSFMVKNCSRKIRILMDYNLYEYTVHLSK